MKKIYLSPSSQPENKYAYGNTNEQEQCRKIANACEKALKRCGFEVRNGQTGDHISRTKESNAWKADLHIAIHTNAFNGLVRGVRLFYYHENGNSYKACKAIFNEMVKISPVDNNNMSMNKEWYEMCYTNCSPVYCEIGFHDNAQDAKWIVNNTTQIGEALAKGVCAYYGKQYITSDTNLCSKMYQAVAGSFSVKENCEKQIEKLKKAGFDAFMQIK